MDVTATALSGLRAATADLQTAANNTANAASPGFKKQEVNRIADVNGGVRFDISTAPQPDGDVDLAEESVKADIATYNFKANLQVLKKQQEIEKSLLDIQA